MSYEFLKMEKNSMRPWLIVPTGRKLGFYAALLMGRPRKVGTIHEIAWSLAQ